MGAYRDQRVVVLGLGETGWSVARWLHAQDARVVVADTRAAPPHAQRLAQEMPDVTLHAGPFQIQTFEDVDLVVASPGVPLADPVLQAVLARGVPVVGDVELLARALAHSPTRVIAITGSNGKSTVTSMVGAMCRAAGLETVVAGNIGLPVLDALTAWGAQPPAVLVLELSSFQLETTSSLDPVAATVLNVTEDHLDRYAGMAAYAAAKARIFAGRGVQVLNRQDAWSTGMALPGRAVVSFGLDEPADGQYGLVQQDGRRWLAWGPQRLLACDAMAVAGLHNAANALAALALTESLGLPREAMLQGLRDFRGLPHRVAWVADVNQVAFYDDSKGTNVGATEAALLGMTQPVVLIAGGDGKGQDFTPLRAAVARSARAVVLLGRDAPLIEQALAGLNLPVERVDSMELATQRAFALAQAGDAVLMSPACASLDMFRNYAHRAEVFVQAVQALAAQEGGR